MRLQKSTRYALYAALEMAGLPEGAVVTVGEVAARYRLPEGALAKTFQRLVRQGLATGTRGVGGGYRLARPASEITTLEVVAAFETARAPRSCVLVEDATDCPACGACAIARLFDEVEELERATLASVTLATLAR